MHALALTCFATAIVCAPVAILNRNSDRVGALYTAGFGDLAAAVGLILIAL
jgi:hypothetical protein